MECRVPDEFLSSYEGFRRFSVRRAFQNTYSTFFRFTAWYLAQNNEIFSYTDADNLAAKVDKELSYIHDEDIRGWRFWASFFGIGVLHNMFLIPNMFLRLHDALKWDLSEEDPLARGKSLPFSKFYSWLKQNCPEAVWGDDKNQLCLALSNGLRLLHDRGLIELSYEPDSAGKWQLYPMDAHLINDVSNIAIRV